MVQFPGCRSITLCIHVTVTGNPTGRVTPFGYLRINGCLLLPAAFRSLPRPSSPDSSKASSVDPFSLDHISHCPFPVSFHHITSNSLRHPKMKGSHVKELLLSPRLSPRNSLSFRASPALLYLSGGKGIRTPDLWLAKPPLWPAELYPRYAKRLYI